jgi:hypothetical protein
MNGVFLHTGWRTAGTWLWSRLRINPAHLCFYEPLHESLPTMTEADMSSFGPASWPSRHPHLDAPYFVEYIPLLASGGGVRGADEGFGFDQFFRAPAAPDAGLRGYVASLTDEAGRLNRLPVLKFTRSLGRVAWFRKNFPDVFHAAVVRQPWMQFRSAWRCFIEDSNPYFLIVPLVILERNADHPPAATLIRALRLPVIFGQAGTATARIIYWMEQASGLPPAVLYRASLALWLICLPGAVESAQLVLDGDAPVRDLALAFTAASGITLEAGTETRPAAGTLALEARGLGIDHIRQCHRRATGALIEWIAPGTLTRLLRWLDRAELDAARDLVPPERAPQGRELLRGALPGIQFTF